MNLKLLTASAIGLALLYSPAKAQDVGARINKLEQEIQLLKRQQEVNDEKAATAAEKSANVEIGKKGLAISSPDKKYQLEVHGLFQLDNRNFINDKSANSKNLKNDFLVRRARPILTFKAGDTSLYFVPDFAGTSSTSNNTKTVDAYAEHKFSNAFKGRIGKFKPPIGLEQLQSDPDTFFTERSYAASLAPSRDVGIQLAGEILPDTLEYQLGIFDGGADLSDTHSDSDDKKDFAGRIFAKPFRNSGLVTLQGFGIGIGGSIGDREGRYISSTDNNRILPSYSTVGQNTFFSYDSSAFANGDQWRLSPQAYWFAGNKGLLAEYAVSTQNVTLGAISRELQNTAWNVAASYVLTGEDVNYSGGIKPANDFNPSKGGWGAVEVVARTTSLKIDDDAFPTFASISTSAREATTYSGGLNWYWSENLKLATNYNFTQFDGGATNGDRADEHAILSRVQLRF